MARPRNPEPSDPLLLKLPASERARLDTLLWSEAEGRVPQGAYLRFFRQLLAEAFSTTELDLSPYLASLPGERVIRARPETLAALTSLLQQTTLE